MSQQHQKCDHHLSLKAKAVKVASYKNILDLLDKPLDARIWQTALPQSWFDHTTSFQTLCRSLSWRSKGNNSPVWGGFCIRACCFFLNIIYIYIDTPYIYTHAYVCIYIYIYTSWPWHKIIENQHTNMDVHMHTYTWTRLLAHICAMHTYSKIVRK